MCAHLNQRVGSFRDEKLSLIAQRSIMILNLHCKVVLVNDLSSRCADPASPSLYNMLTYLRFASHCDPISSPMVSHKVGWDGLGSKWQMANPQGVPATEVGSHDNPK
jgi:hypothetical protein